jgi:hypothetical protein
VSVYLDASFLVSLYCPDVFSARAIAFLQKNLPTAIVSDFAAVEFSSAVSKRARVGQMTDVQARQALLAFDGSVPRVMHRVQLESADLVAADGYLRRFQLKLRTADAVNIAIAQRHSATLVSFDQNMVAAAKQLALPVSIP